jgi:hypothetical protein
VKLSKRLAVAVSIPAFALAGCYIGSDDRSVWPPLDPAPISGSAPTVPYQPAPSELPASAVLLSNAVRYQVHLGN